MPLAVALSVFMKGFCGSRMSVKPLALFLMLLSLFFLSCQLDRDERVEREERQLTGLLGQRGDTVLRHAGILYAPATAVLGGAAHGDTLELYLALYALVEGRERLLLSNIDSVVRSGGLGNPVLSAGIPFLYVVGESGQLVEGLELAFDHYMGVGARGWVGVPSDLGYGDRTVLGVPRWTPLACQVECVGIR